MAGYHDKYDVVRELGRGGMGVVWLATDKARGAKVAVKELAEWATDDTRALKRFRREAQTLARLAHPNVVKLLAFEERPQPYIVFEFLEGARPLDELLREGALPANRLALARGLVAGMAYLHRNGLLHRDLKPGNVLLDAHGVPRIIDFGLARQNELTPDETRCTVDGEVLGTLSYMAPEQMLNSDVDFRADVYALGLVLIEIFAGRPVFSSGGTSPILATERLGGRMPGAAAIVPGLSPRLVRLIDRCVAIQPDQRPADASEVEAALAGGRTKRVAAAAALLAAFGAAAFALAPGREPEAVRSVAPSPPPSSAPAVDRGPLLSSIRAAVGDDSVALEKLLRAVETRATKERSAARDALQQMLGGPGLDGVLEQLKRQAPLALAGADAAPDERRALDHLGLIGLLDEYLVSVGEAPALTDQIERIAGVHAELREFEPVVGRPLLHYGRPSPMREHEQMRISMRLDDPPDGDAVVTLVFNAFDPKLVLELTVNRALRLYFRNRLGTGEARPYAVRDYLNVRNGKIETTDYGNALPRMLVLSRRIPRSALRRGENDFGVRFLDLPGRLRLPGGREWQSGPFRKVSFWHVYLTFPR